MKRGQCPVRSLWRGSFFGGSLKKMGLILVLGCLFLFASQKFISLITPQWLFFSGGLIWLTGWVVDRFAGYYEPKRCHSEKKI